MVPSTDLLKPNAAGDRSGSPIAITNNGNTVAIGAQRNDGNGEDSGHVRIFDWNIIAWDQRGQDIGGEATGDFSGKAVSLSNGGNTVAIGAYFNEDNGNNSGHVRIYAWNGSAWLQKGVDIDGEERRDQSGTSVSLSNDGNTVAIGAPYNDGNDYDSGHVRIYDWILTLRI